jgi:hypothetical protein
MDAHQQFLKVFLTAIKNKFSHASLNQMTLSNNKCLDQGQQSFKLVKKISVFMDLKAKHVVKSILASASSSGSLHSEVLHN